jgi:hypothetical protein
MIRLTASEKKEAEIDLATPQERRILDRYQRLVGLPNKLRVTDRHNDGRSFVGMTLKRRWQGCTQGSVGTVNYVRRQVRKLSARLRRQEKLDVAASLGSGI